MGSAQSDKDSLHDRMASALALRTTPFTSGSRSAASRKQRAASKCSCRLSWSLPSRRASSAAVACWCACACVGKWTTGWVSTKHLRMRVCMCAATPNPTHLHHTARVQPKGRVVAMMRVPPARRLVMLVLLRLLRCRRRRAPRVAPARKGQLYALGGPAAASARVMQPAAQHPPVLGVGSRWGGSINSIRGMHACHT